MAALPGGDAAARWPVQAAAGFLAGVRELPELTAPPFQFPDRYLSARMIASRGVRSFVTTSAGRLFDTVAALCGFTGPVSYEGQAAMWLEHLARASSNSGEYPVTFDGIELDWRQTLSSIAAAREAGADPADVARGFHRGFARATAAAAAALAKHYAADAVVISGGVFQNRLLFDELVHHLSEADVKVFTNAAVPPNDGGISLGQAAIAAMQS
jgi:hydrogenase maturation protein HypF